MLKKLWKWSRMAPLRRLEGWNIGGMISLPIKSVSRHSTTCPSRPKAGLGRVMMMMMPLMLLTLNMWLLWRLVVRAHPIILPLSSDSLNSFFSSFSYAEPSPPIVATTGIKPMS